MERERLTAFSDGVIAIIITIMVLELRAPHETDWTALRELTPIFLSYVLSFLYVAIYWNNHHHLFYTVARVNGAILWANTCLLFWLSLIPFATAWLGQNYLATWPVVLYGVALLMPALTYKLLQTVILRASGTDPRLALALGNDIKGVMSPLFYGVAIGLAFWNPIVSEAIYALVALMWIVPDRRIEKFAS